MVISTDIKNVMMMCVLLSASLCFAATPDDVYLLIGQSNMAGFLGKEG